jgi:putative membrane protein
MTTLFAFLHHLCAFTLVAAVAIEFTLIKQELTLASARSCWAWPRARYW